ncbi:MAG: hypothetical protein CFH06_01049 [Alphaproteobacteria bacterium MarineAlpha3_Bin5]|nr:MAG: hypothetical protein CFH06_01049 [Alphaproteobacteria bacterium MarineAlpha3_Bin5]
MITIEKFLFDREFGKPRASPVIYPENSEDPINTDEESSSDSALDALSEAENSLPEIEELPPSYSEEEFEHAKQQAYEEGKKEGADKEGKEIEHRILSSLVNIENQLGNSIENQEISIREIFDEAISISVAIPRKLFPTIEKTVALPEIERITAHVLELLVEEPKLKITVHEELTSDIEQRLNSLAEKSGFNGKFYVVGDPNIGPSDCKIDWQKGSAVRDTDKLKDKVNSVIETYLADNKKQIATSLKTEQTNQKPVSDLQKAAVKSADEGHSEKNENQVPDLQEAAIGSTDEGHSKTSSQTSTNAHSKLEETEPHGQTNPVSSPDPISSTSDGYQKSVDLDPSDDTNSQEILENVHQDQSIKKEKDGETAKQENKQEPTQLVQKNESLNNVHLESASPEEADEKNVNDDGDTNSSP